MKKTGVGDSIIESLIRSSSLRSFGNSQTLLDSLPQALRYAKMIISTKDGERFINFDMLTKPKLIESKDNIELSIKNEADLLGLNVTLFKTRGMELTNKIIDIKENTPVEVVVHLDYLKKIKDKNGNEMAIASVHDSSAGIEMFVFGKNFEFIKNTKNGSIVRAKVYKRNGSFSLNGN